MTNSAVDANVILADPNAHGGVDSELFMWAWEIVAKFGGVVPAGGMHRLNESAQAACGRAAREPEGDRAA